MLSARVQGNIFYTTLNTGSVPSDPAHMVGNASRPVVGGGDVPGGCCADTLRMFDRDSGDYTDIDIDGILMGLFGDWATDSFAYTNHMFDLTMIKGAVVALLDVVYREPDLNSALETPLLL